MRIPVEAFRAGFIACASVVAYLAFAPLETPPPILSWDKGNHLLAFFVMAWLADAGWSGRRRAAARWGLLLGYGLAIEAIQHWLPLRHFSLLDLVADGVGILMYLGIISLLRGVGIGMPSGRKTSEGSTQGKG